jgi:hypothetical protein
MSNKPFFLTISIPDLDWLHSLIREYNRKSEHSISHHLVSLVGEDLHRQGVITDSQWEQIKELSGSKTRLTEQKKFKNLSWYIPYPIIEWLPGKIKKVAKSRSFYVWNLFVRAHKSTIPKELLAEWGDPETMDMTASRVQIHRAPLSDADIRARLEAKERALAKDLKNVRKAMELLPSKKPSRKPA